MNKAELVSAIAEKTGQSQSTVGDVLSAFEAVVTSAVAGGTKVQIPGFLSFEKAERAARTGRNPATGEEMQIPAATVPKVKIGKSFKDAVGK
ncbi:MAG TPA: HU family DNA-binding protein [Acidimicrobiales bacterium]|nr:HU family DNA-binding protein [Acidimicrobiales bacterium]